MHFPNLSKFRPITRQMHTCKLPLVFWGEVSSRICSSETEDGRYLDIIIIDRLVSRKKNLTKSCPVADKGIKKIPPPPLPDHGWRDTDPPFKPFLLFFFMPPSFLILFFFFPPSLPLPFGQTEKKSHQVGNNRLHRKIF